LQQSGTSICAGNYRTLTERGTSQKHRSNGNSAYSTFVFTIFKKNWISLSWGMLGYSV
jgi:hypothetical protein